MQTLTDALVREVPLIDQLRRAWRTLLREGDGMHAKAFCTLCTLLTAFNIHVR